jgi:hypothetical protein
VTDQLPTDPAIYKGGETKLFWFFVTLPFVFVLCMIAIIVSEMNANG